MECTEDLVCAEYFALIDTHSATDALALAGTIVHL